MFVPAFLLHFEDEIDYSSDIDDDLTVEFKVIKATPWKPSKPKSTPGRVDGEK